MDRQRGRRKIKTLWALALLGIAYSSLLYALGTLTGRHNLDGIISVLLGLYICSHPAANMVELLFFSRGVRGLFSPRPSLFLWLALNGLVLLAGWIVIFLGTIRFVGMTH